MLIAGGRMSSQPGAGDRESPAEPSIAAAYTPAQWRQLTRLPGRVVIAVIESSARNAADRVAEAVAGLGGIASGRSFDSDLVRAVAAAIYAETERDLVAPDPGHPPTDVLSDCRAVAQLLASRADPADAAAYRQWVQGIAARAAPPGDGRESADGHFLAELGRALGLR
jgi:hypothetical protein